MANEYAHPAVLSTGVIILCPADVGRRYQTSDVLVLGSFIGQVMSNAYHQFAEHKLLLVHTTQKLLRNETY